MGLKRAVVATIHDVPDGQMKQVCVDDHPILLANVDGTIYATGAHCSHYGAPLVKGALAHDRIICPWHNSCYSAKTGQQQQPPGFDDLPHYPVMVEGDQIVVELPEHLRDKKQPDMARYDPAADSRTFVILGTGAAGTNAAVTLRKDGFAGRILMITADDQLPQDRTALSKKYLSGKASEQSMQLRSPDFYQRHSIEVHTNTPVSEVRTQTQQIMLANGDTLHYDCLLLATGSTPRTLQIPGADLNEVFTLRTYDDAASILNAADAATCAVVIGASFIGMETAASLTQQGLSVTVVSPHAVPFEKVLGREIGTFFKHIHEQKGVVFKCNAKATQIEGDDSVESVVLDNGDRIPADLVIVGVGVTPATNYLNDISRDPQDHSIHTDCYLKMADHVYAAGDIATFPDWRTNELTRVEHWQLAAQHGRIAAHNMLGLQIPFRGVPFFWTNQFGTQLRYVGHVESWNDLVINGSVNDGEFLAFYGKNNRVLAVAGVNRDADIAAISELMRLDQMPNLERIKSGSVNWQSELR